MSSLVTEEIAKRDIAIRDYNFIKHTLNVIIDNNIEIILLVGSGGNGKTHLIKEMNEKLIENNYEILHECPLDLDIFQGFEQLQKDAKKNVIMTCIVNAYTSYTNHSVIKPNNMLFLDMEHIKF